jgi:hypothetical protein
MSLIVEKRENPIAAAIRQQQPGYVAQGYALAQTVIATIRTQGDTWVNYVAKLCTFGNEALDAFVAELQKHRTEMQKHVDERKGSEDYEVYRKAKASAIVQMSNLKTIARAMNAGWSPAIRTDEQGKNLKNAHGDPKLADPFYTIIAQARVFLSSTASLNTRRPAKPFVEKVAALAEREGDALTADAIMEAVKLLTEAAKALAK